MRNRTTDGPSLWDCAAGVFMLVWLAGALVTLVAGPFAAVFLIGRLFGWWGG